MARRRRRGVWFLVLLLLLIGLVVGADRVGAYAAERTVAEKVSQEVDKLGVSSSEPDVTIGGFPFLTQVVDGKYEEITIRLRDVSANGVTVPTLDIHATGVNATVSTLMSGDGPITADQVAGTATVGYDSVRALINQRGLTLAEEGGKLRMNLPVTAGGQSFTAVALADVTVVGGVVRLNVTSIRAEGVTLPPLGQRLLDGYKSGLSAEIKLPPLPFGLQINGVQAKPEGLAVSASAASVPLSG